MPELLNLPVTIFLIILCIGIIIISFITKHKANNLTIHKICNITIILFFLILFILLAVIFYDISYKEVFKRLILPD